MKKYSEAFIGFDTAKKKHAIAIAEDGRNGEIRYLGEIDSSPATVEKVIGKLAERYATLHVCYEAGPTGYGLYRQVKAVGHECAVVAPSLIPRKSGERIKTNRRDAVTLARALRAGDLTPVWMPDAIHEAVRDLSRAREAAGEDVRKKRQQLLSFLLRHGRIFSGRKHWSLAHRRWLAEQNFEHPAQQIVFQDAIDAIEDGCRALAPPRRAASRDRAELVDGAGGCRVSGDARRLLHRRGDVRGGDRRCAPLRQPAPVDGVPWPHPLRAFDRRDRSTWRPHARGQSARPTRARRRRLDLPLSSPCQRDPAAPARGTAERPSATSPGRPRFGSAPGTVASPPPARRRRWSLPQSLAKWLRSFGPSVIRSNH